MKLAVTTKQLITSCKGLVDFLKRTTGEDRGKIVCRVCARVLKSGAQQMTVTVSARGFWAQAIHDAHVQTQGEVLLNISSLFGLSPKAAKTILDLEKDKRLRFKSGAVEGSIFLAKAAPVAERPSIPLFTTVSCGQLLRQLEAVNVKPYLATTKRLYGVVRVKPDRLVVSSSDGFMVAVSSEPAECSIEGEIEDSVVDIGLLLDVFKTMWPKEVRQENDGVSFGSTESALRLRGPTFDVCIPKLAVDMQDLDQYITALQQKDDATATHLVAATGDLLDAVQAVSAIASTAIKSQDAAIIVNASNVQEGKLTCRAESTAGNSTATVKVKPPVQLGSQLDAQVSGRQLGDALSLLKAAKSVTVRIFPSQLVVWSGGQSYAMPISQPD